MTIIEQPKEYKVIGTRPIRHDGLDKVIGKAQYGADLKLPGMIWGALTRSPYAHARIKRIDTSKAEQAPGVMAVITGADMPVAEAIEIETGEEVTNLAHASDKLMARDKVVYKGHPVAAVAAADQNAAIEAARLIEVEYEVLQPVLTVDEAMASGAPLVHEDYAGKDLGEETRNTNVADHFRHETGDTAAGFAQAAVVVEREFELTMVHQGYIEPHNATALWKSDGKIEIWTSTQGAFGVRSSVAPILRVPETDIRVTPLEIGGGFGGKIPIYLEPVCAVLSKKAGRPVKVVMDRKSVFEATGPTPGGRIRVKMGANDKGDITAAEVDLYYEAGAYPGSPVGAGAMCALACYRVANARVDGYDILVNKPKTAAYRAPGATQAAYAVESVVDEICQALGMDPLDFRLHNATREGDRRADGPVYPRIGNLEQLQALKDSEHYRTPLEREGADGRLRGRGVANGFWFNGGMQSCVTINVNSDGEVGLVEGSVDIGGTRASIAMQAAEVLGLRAEEVHPVVVDTDSVGYTDMTGGSRTTNATGYAAYLAAQNVIAGMKERAAILWESNADDVEFEDGVFSSKHDSELKVTFKELAAKLTETGGPLAASGSIRQRGSGGGFGSHLVDVEIDPETGKVDVIRYTAAQDVGKAIHPSYVEGQIQGGATQGIGWALNEEYFWSDQGVMENSTFLDYRMPTALDLPMIDAIIVEVPNPTHPFGVRGVGETPIVAPVGAVANAIHDAVGVRLTQAPMKPQRVLAAIKEKNGNGA
ncbi:MAG: xanthine dehydrogenase family protein molybdopterin-binding subunit [Dehalococcoidia bacterium]|nr:xanthine dehydrogenase family protein molybdopterin-binding subunit [Dehalococcoidia bacterium]